MDPSDNVGSCATGGQCVLDVDICRRRITAIYSDWVAYPGPGSPAEFFKAAKESCDAAKAAVLCSRGVRR